MSPEPFVSRAKAPPAKRSEKGYGHENDAGKERRVNWFPAQKERREGGGGGGGGGGG